MGQLWFEKSVREVGGSIPGPAKSRSVSPTALSITAIFLHSRVVQALSSKDEPRHSLHALVRCRDYNEDFCIVCLKHVCAGICDRILFQIRVV